MAQAQVLGHPEIVEIFFDRVDADAERILAIVDELCQPIVTSAEGMTMAQQRRLRRSGWPMVSPDDSHSRDETWQFFNAASPYWQFYLCAPDDGRRDIDAELRQGSHVLWKQEHVGAIWPHPLTARECRLQVICRFAHPVIIEQLISIVRYILAIERGRELADRWREAAVARFLHRQEPNESADVIELGSPEQITILHEQLNVGSRSLFSLLQEWLTPPMAIWSETYTARGALLPNGTFWQFDAIQISDSQLDVSAILLENRSNDQRMRMQKETVGRICAFNVSDRGNESQVEIVSYYHHPEICGFLIDLTGNILNRVNGWEWGRLAVWRRETRTRVLSLQPNTQERSVGHTQETNDTRQGESVTSKNVMSTRRKIVIGLGLVLSIAVLLFAVTMANVWGVLPAPMATVLFWVAAALAAATTFVAAWNNVLALVEKLFGKI